MKKYILTIDDKKYEVEVNVEENVAEVSVNGKSFTVDIETAEEPAERKVVRPLATKKQATNQVTKPVAETKSVGVINSPLPGVVLDILVKVGEHVKRGDVLIILEAMKMENNIMAGNDGIVKSILVEQGRTVVLGEALIDIEEIKILN